MNEIQLLKAQYPEVLHGTYVNCIGCIPIIKKLTWILMAYANRYGVVPTRIHQVTKDGIILFGNPSSTELKWAEAASKFI